MSDPRIGKLGTAIVTWMGRQRSETEGVIIGIAEHINEVYLDTDYGPVAGDLETLDVIEEEDI